VKTPNYLFLELFQQRLSRHSRRLAQIIQLRMEPAYLNTTDRSVRAFINRDAQIRVW